MQVAVRGRLVARGATIASAATRCSGAAATPKHRTAVVRAAGFATRWHTSDDKFLSEETLSTLAQEISTFRQNRTRGEQLQLFSDLSSTYVARFQSLIREENSFVKSLIEDRLREWSPQQLRREGFALFGLTVRHRGTLFQDQVMRFSLKSNDALPFHRFTNGDVVRVTPDGADPLGSTAIDGVVLDRRQGYIDVCFKKSDVFSISESRRYRLDHFYNSVTFDRMVNGLKTFVHPKKAPISRTVRDLILYSYPNSTLRISRLPGGLKLGLPTADPSSPPQPAVLTTNGEAPTTTAAGSSSFTDVATAPVIPSPVFETNSRLQALANQSAQPSLKFTDAEVATALEKVQALSQLNESQTAALLATIDRPISLIQGPPGTGKTKTACALLAVLAQLYQKSGAASGVKHKILACAQSNVATDNILEGLAQLGVKVVRYGRPASIRTHHWQYTIDAQVQARPEWKKALANAERCSKALDEAVVSNADRQVRQTLTIAVRRAYDKLDALEDELCHKILREADVVVTSCSSSGADGLREFVTLNDVRFSTVVIDEAAQSTESGCLPPLLYGCERLVLIGDQNQLPPVITSPQAAECGLGVSLFSRLCVAGLTPAMLKQQYRSHPAIANLVSERFYQSQIVSETTAESRAPPKGFDWPDPSIPIVFIDVAPERVPEEDLEEEVQLAEEEQLPDEADPKSTSCISNADDEVSAEATEAAEATPESISASATAADVVVKQPRGFEVSSSMTHVSYANEKEAAVISRILARLLNEGDVAIADIGVTSPYNGQVGLLVDLFRERGWVRPHGAAHQSAPAAAPAPTPTPQSDALAASEAPDTPEYQPDTVDAAEELIDEQAIEAAELEVRSVDGFQGREKDVIILSAVRSNNHGNVGFLRDWRRLNVALSRAKRGLIVVGDAHTLSADEHWGGFVEYCKQNGLFTVGYIDEQELSDVKRIRRSLYRRFRARSTADSLLELIEQRKSMTTSSPQAEASQGAQLE